MKLLLIMIIASFIVLSACSTPVDNADDESESDDVSLKEKSSMSYYVTKEGGTEEAFNNAYWDEKRDGIYVDVNTGEALFSSLDKYDSGTGWPSFTKPIDTSKIDMVEDKFLGIARTEVRTDESHLGHVFDDGPDGGDRFCINSAAMKFIPYEELETTGYGVYKALFPYEEAVLAGGCFWGVEKLLEEVPGVISASSGYAGGSVANPSYAQVSSGTTGHAEAVRVAFDPKTISYEEILDIFWRLHDPTQLNRQGADIGSQYRSAIFYMNSKQKTIAEDSKNAFDAKEIFRNSAVTEIVSFTNFYPAEEYHQNYYDDNPGRTCHVLRQD